MGNNHVQGKVEDENGKVIKFINNKNVTIYTGKITQNKLLDSEYIELNQQLSKELAKSPNIFIFKENSYIKSFLHPHKLKYKSAQNDGHCDFCLGNFGKDSETFGCRKCNFDLCKDCIFMEENIFFSKLINLMKKKNITIINSDNNNFIIKSKFHPHNLKYLNYNENNNNNNNEFICDLCKEKYSDNRPFHCNSCPYNICISCILQNSSSLYFNNYIIYLFDIPEKELNREILLFRFNAGDKNEIFNIVEVFYDDKKIELKNLNDIWFFNYNFGKPGKYEIKVIFKKYFPFLNGFSQKNDVLYSLDLSNFYAGEATTMKNFLADCGNLEYVNFSNINTSKVTNMQGMFYNCEKLKEIKGLEYFDTSNVESFTAMFANCKSLKYLNLSNFNTPNLTDIEGMFSGCYSLYKIDGLNNFNTNKIENMYALFNNCHQLEYLDLSSFNTSNVKIMNYMFNRCNNLKEIKGRNKFIFINKEFTITFPIKKDLYTFEGTIQNYAGYDDRPERKKRNEFLIPIIYIEKGSIVNIKGNISL